MDKIKVNIENLDRTIEVEVGQDLRSALLDNRIDLYAGVWKLLNCQGKGTCGTCQVEIVDGEGLNDKSPYEKLRMKAQAKGDPAKTRLACLTRCYRDSTIRTLAQPAVPAESQL